MRVAKHLRNLNLVAADN